MKALKVIPIIVLFSTITLAKSPQLEKTKSIVTDQHSSIYTMKIKRVVSAIDIGDFEKDRDYFKMLKIACERNNCSPLERRTIISIGQQIVNCQIKHLKSHGIENPDATSICESKQAIFGCDSLPSSLLRQMCYSGNQYSSRVWQEKELRIKSRMPASTK